MARIRNLLIVGAVGAAAAYFLDPDLGRTRRARLQQQLGTKLREGRQGIERASKQLQDRAQEAASQVPGVERPDDDLTVLSRVESVLFAMPDFPRGAITAEVIDGHLVLRGDVTGEAQAREIVEAAGRIKGVASVESLLRVPGPEAPAADKAAARQVE